MLLSKMKLCHYAECHSAECRDLFIGLLNVIMLSVVWLNVVMLSVMAPAYATADLVTVVKGFIAVPQGRCYDTLHNGTQDNDIQDNNTH